MQVNIISKYCKYRENTKLKLLQHLNYKFDEIILLEKFGCLFREININTFWE